MKKCVNCRKQFEEELFLCPHCGKIYGDPNIKKTCPLQMKPLKAWHRKMLLCTALLVILLAIGILVATFLFSGFDDPATTTGPSVIPPKQYRYVLQVTDSNGIPISSAQVAFGRDGPASFLESDIQYTLTDEAGNAECMLSDGGILYAWVVSAPEDYAVPTSVMALYPQGGSQKPIALSLPYQKRDPFTIHVVDSNGNPVPSVSYRYGILQTGLEVTGVTDGDGCIYIPREGYDDLSEFYISILSVPIVYDPAAVGTYLPGAGDQDYTITLPPKPKVVYKVTVMDANGNPLKDVGVALVEYNDILGFFPDKKSQDCPVATTDENGCCEFVMDEEGDYAAQLCFYPTGFLALSTFARFDDYFNATVTVGEISSGNTFAGMCLINVRIVDQHGNPLPWVYLTYVAFAGTFGISGERYSNLDGYLTIWCDMNSKGTITAQMGAVTIKMPFDTNTDADATIEIVFYNESDAPVMPIMDAE